MVFRCYKSHHDNSELRASAAIFKAGYTIDSLMLKYQGADWSNARNWNCNAGYAALNIFAFQIDTALVSSPRNIGFIFINRNNNAACESYMLCKGLPCPHSAHHELLVVMPIILLLAG